MVQEILTVEEFADRLKIGRSTLFDWLGKGILVPGKHYIKVGRVLRFVWSDDVVDSLLVQTVSTTQSLQRAGRKGKPVAAGQPINWDC